MLTRSLQQRHGRSIRTTVRTTIAIRRRRWNVRALYTRVCRYRNDGPFDFAHGVWTRSTPCVAQDQTLEAHGCFARDDINDEYIDSHRLGKHRTCRLGLSLLYANALPFPFPVGSLFSTRLYFVHTRMFTNETSLHSIQVQDNAVSSSPLCERGRFCVSSFLSLFVVVIINVCCCFGFGYPWSLFCNHPRRCFVTALVHAASSSSFRFDDDENNQHGSVWFQRDHTVRRQRYHRSTYFSRRFLPVGETDPKKEPGKRRQNFSFLAEFWNNGEHKTRQHEERNEKKHNSHYIVRNGNLWLCFCWYRRCWLSSVMILAMAMIPNDRLFVSFNAL